MRGSMEIIHEPELQRFVAPSAAGDGLLNYATGAAEVTITHTYVPPSRRGQGVAEALTQAALTWIRRTGLRPAATCSYAVRYLERNPSA